MKSVVTSCLLDILMKIAIQNNKTQKVETEKPEQSRLNFKTKPMAYFLTKKNADALCTAILLGFSVPNNGKKINFQYFLDSNVSDPDKKKKNEAELTAHVTVKKLFEDMGVLIDISQSTPVDDFGYIIARTSRMSNAQIAALETAQYTNYLKKLTETVNKKNPVPKGAYIGGRSTVNQLTIVGPSRLTFYPAKYRAVDASVEQSYNLAKTSTNDAIAAIQEVQTTFKPSSGYTLTLVDLIKPVEENYYEPANPAKPNPGPPTPRLFASNHGMILAMIKYATDIDNNSFIFEMALGANTQKVSSCVPCSMFMAANERPPTSIHLGRGDNWNIPDEYKGMMRNNWRKNVIAWYKKGKDIMIGKKLKTDIFTALAPFNDEDIPDIFLEALTFEGSFTDKIISTLNGNY